MENQLNCSLKLTLEKMALRRVVINLWIENDVSAAIEKFRDSLKFEFRRTFYEFHNYLQIWQSFVEYKVRDKISKLALPDPLKNQLTALVRAIGSDILRWKRFHEYYLSTWNEYFSVNCLKLLHWNCKGAIDYQKTAKELIRLRMLDSEKRYRLACCHCLVDYIPLLWNELDEESRLNFEGYNPFEINMRLDYVWPYILKGEESVLEEFTERRSVSTRGRSFNECILETEACTGNRAATEYFLQRLTDEEKDSALMTTVEAVVYRHGNSPGPNFLQGRRADVLCYLLPMMGPEQQMQILKDYPFHVLGCFLDWPWHDLFLDATKFISNFLPVSGHDEFYWTLENCGYYFPNLIQQLFRMPGDGFVREFSDHIYKFCHNGGVCLLTKFFKYGDTETIKEVFRNASDENRMKLVSCSHFFYMFNALIANNNWRLIKLCLQEAVKSEEDKKILKKKFLVKTRVMFKEWEQLSKLFDETEVTSNKGNT